MTEMITDSELNDIVSATKGRDIRDKLLTYHIKANVIKRKGYSERTFLRFNQEATIIARHVYGWDQTPPVWYHGGPAGRKSGEILDPTKKVRRPLFWVLSSNRPETYSYFTHDRSNALHYASAYGDRGRIYRVQPETDMQIDPEAFILAMLMMKDPDFNIPDSAMLELVVLCMQTYPGWRAETVRVLGAG